MSVHARVFAVAAVAATVLGTRAHTAAAQACLEGTLEPIEILLPDGGDPPDFVQSSEPDLIDFFNLAHCTCQVDFAARFQISGANQTLPDEVGEVWVGNDCDTAVDMETRLGQCEKIYEYTDAASQLDTQQDLAIGSHVLMFPNVAACGSESVTRGVHLLVDDDNANDATFLCAGKAEVAIDSEPPPLAADPEALPGEGGVVVRWSPPTARASDVQFYQVLCQRVDGPSEADDLPRDEPEYQTSMMLCNMDDGTRLVDVGGGPPADAGVPTADAGPPADAGPTGSTPLDSLDIATVCGTATGTETSIQVNGLENDVAYHVALLSIDDARNVSGWYLGTVTPLPVKDFWEDYHDKGGSADGGFCLGVTGSGSAPLGDLLVVLGAVLLSLLPGRLRGRRRAPLAARAAIGAGALLLVLGAAAAAHAQGYDPYWERWDTESDTVGPTIPYWNFAFKAGPYRPSVDDEFTGLPEGTTPPFAAMFGTDDNFFGVLELERFFLFPAGQLGAYASIGLTSQRADAFQVDESGNVLIDPDTGKPLRAVGNRVIFRLVPASLGAVYRFTLLDDRVGVPLVPYGKLGLSYYLWWVRSPDGSFAEAPSTDCPDPEAGGCDGDRALGASLGWQATVGLAIRAERIDPQAATNLRNEMGIEHAGFFAELMYAKVDGFGSASKLSVGDRTWLLGVNFEF